MFTDVQMHGVVMHAHATQCCQHMLWTSGLLQLKQPLSLVTLHGPSAASQKNLHVG